LYCGGNLKRLSDWRNFPKRVSIWSISIRRLIRTLFREPTGQVSQAQFHAFTDTWS
jgi:hypothetical protein